MPRQSRPYLILHKVRGEPAFDIATYIDELGPGRDYWIVTTSGHRAYPCRWWDLEDLADVSDINEHGFHDYPWTFDHTLPPDLPDHYEQAKTPVRKPGSSDPAHDISLLFS